MCKLHALIFLDRMYVYIVFIVLTLKRQYFEFLVEKVEILALIICVSYKKSNLNCCEIQKGEFINDVRPVHKHRTKSDEEVESGLGVGGGG